MLTKKMLEVLKELAKPGARAPFMGYMGRFRPNAYYYLTTTHDHCTSQVRGLIKRNLVEWVPRGDFGEGHVIINESGRKALKDCE